MEAGVSLIVCVKTSVLITSYQDKITAQMTRLGGSFDWDKVAFTMDEVSRIRSDCGMPSDD